MAHFAQIDENAMVTQVIVINNDILLDEEGNESEVKGIAFCETLFNGGRWIQTSYNAKIRKHYAGIGFQYDETLDAFIPPSPYASWILDEESCTWTAPIPMPTPSENCYMEWDEGTISWIEKAVTQ